MKLCLAFDHKEEVCGVLARVTSPPFPPLLICHHLSQCHIRHVLLYGIYKKLIVYLYHCGIVFNCEWDLLLLHYALEIIRIVLSHVDDNSL